MADTQPGDVRADEPIQPMFGPERRWSRDYDAWRRARLDRVQASARVWLGVLTTILGLLGSVILFKGGSLVTGVTSNGWLQIALIVLVGAVFSTAVLAVVAGGVATWGGLEDIPPTDQVSRDKHVDATKTAQSTGWAEEHAPDAGPAARPRAPQAAPPEQILATQELTRAVEPTSGPVAHGQAAPAAPDRPGQAGESGAPGPGGRREEPHRRTRRWQELLVRGGLFIAGTPKHEVTDALEAFGPDRTPAADRARKSDWELYKKDIVDNANRNRIFLHASRVLGVLAAALIAVLAVVAVIAATVAPVPPSVIVVNHGRVSCGSVGSYAKAAKVTQVIAVSNC